MIFCVTVKVEDSLFEALPSSLLSTFGVLRPSIRFSCVRRLETEWGWRPVRLRPMVFDLWNHRELVGIFTRREIQGRYKGTSLGLVWSIANPLALLLIYTFAFGVIFNARWPESRTDRLSEFSITLFCGLIVFNFFSECIAAAPGLILRNPNYVRKVVFPLEILPLSVLGSALFHGAISLALLVAANGLFNKVFHATVLLVPLVALPLMLLTLGVSWFLAGIGVFFRDIQQILALILAGLFFGTPIFYSLSQLPPGLQPLMKLNPLAPIVEAMRQVVLWGRYPEWVDLSVWTVLGALMMSAGYAFFMKTRRMFADLV